MEIFNQNNNRTDLHIDNILSSQPELGPTAPNGGYGWVILIAAIFFKILIPSLSVGFGVFLLFSRLENSAPLEPFLWDNNMVYISWSFVTVWTITEPFTKQLTTTNTWPKLTSASGTSLTSGGLLTMWLGINNGNSKALFLLAGLLAGVGSSMVISQIDIFICQYFNLKLESIKLILNVANLLGFIFTPIALGHNIVQLGMLQIIIWYQAIILQGIIVSVAFKKPKYIKAQKRKYKLIEGILDDEEDIFEKNITELQNPRPNNGNQNHTTNENLSHNIGPLTNEQVIKSRRSDWEKFDDNDRNNKACTSETQKYLQNTFIAANFNNDFDRITNNYPETAGPLFYEGHINNNTSYSYEAPIEIEDPIVFMPITKSASESTRLKCIEVLKLPTFYRCLFSITAAKFSIFIFWTLFPTYLYARIEHLKVHHTAIILGCISIGNLLFITVANWIKVNSKTRKILLWICYWNGAMGYFVLSETAKETTLIFGAVAVSLSINGLHMLEEPLMKTELRGESGTGRALLSNLVGIFFILLLTINISYKSCFRIMSLLQFIVGSVWLSVLILKKIKKRTVVT